MWLTVPCQLSELDVEGHQVGLSGDLAVLGTLLLGVIEYGEAV